jgi:protocatechuate 3,4-dioxygenase, beta subunit
MTARSAACGRGVRHQQAWTGPVRFTGTVSTQADIDREIAALAHQGPDAYPHGPRLDYPPYRSSRLRHPTHVLLRADPEAVERSAPVFGHRDVDGGEADLTAQHGGEPIGERIVVIGRVLDGDGRPVAGQLVEIWQANAAGRYRHRTDRHPAPLDPNFSGVGRCLTGPDGGYAFTTIKPGPYPWGNHDNALRPAHIHFSLFGRAFTQRLVTQMYFPGDPLLPLDPVHRAITDERDRERLVAAYDHDVTGSERGSGYRWDIVLCGADLPGERT